MEQMPKSTHAIMKDVPSMPRMEKFVFNMGQSSNAAIMKDAPTKPKLEECV